LLLVAASLCACAPPPASASASSTHPIVYGADDRRDYFQLDRPEVQERMAASMVALVPRKLLRQSAGGVEIVAPRWGEVEGLCPGEPFAEQPSAAFCSGVLVDWDLVLTAGHCTRAFALPDFVVVFGYYYAQAGKLAVAAADVFDVQEIAAEAVAPAGVRPRIAHAWLRLSRPARPPRAPAPMRLSAAGLSQGQPLLFMAAGGGVPIKTDAGATIADLGDPWSDFFVASTDSFRGASGGGAFDQQLVLLGELERGGPDQVTTDQGCQAAFREPDARAQEELTFAYRAREALCASSPSASALCRPDCGDPCQAGPPPATGGGGCALAGSPPGCAAPWLILVVLGLRRRRSVHRLA
jgi:hypothetical protein